MFFKKNFNPSNFSKIFRKLFISFLLFLSMSILSSGAVHQIMPSKIVSNWKLNGGRVLLDKTVRFHRKWQSPPALDYKLWFTGICPNLKCKKYPWKVVSKDVRRPVNFKIGETGKLLVVVKTTSTHYNHPHLWLEYLLPGERKWKMAYCNRPNVIVYKVGDKQLVWYGRTDPKRPQKTSCVYKKGTKFRLWVEAAKSYDGRAYFPSTARIWVLFSLVRKEKSPTGYLSFVDCKHIRGWAKDPDTTDPIYIHIYADAPANRGGKFLKSVLAKIYRSDIPFRDRNHGFSIRTPDYFKDGKTHLIYIYAIDDSGKKPNVLLKMSPRRIRCSKK